MHREEFQILLKLADGTFYPLVSATGKRRIKLTTSTAHNRQPKAVFEVFARVLTREEPSSDKVETPEETRVASLEIDLTGDSGDGPRDLTFSAELDLFDNLSLSAADPVSGHIRTTEVSLSEWLLSREGEISADEPLTVSRWTPSRIIFLVLFLLLGVGLVIFGAWYLAGRLTVLPPPPLTAFAGSVFPVGRDLL